MQSSIQPALETGPSPGFRSRGSKNQKGGGTFLKYSIACMWEPGGQTWNGGAPISNGGPDTTGLPAGDDLPGEWVLVATRFNVTFLPLKLCYENARTCFSKDAENLTTYGYVLWWSQIVCIRPYSLNTTIAFYFVNKCPKFAVSVWLMACHATMFSHFT